MNGSIVIPQAAKFAGREPITIGFSSIAVRVFMRRMPKRPVIQRRTDPAGTFRKFQPSNP